MLDSDRDIVYSFEMMRRVNKASAIFLAATAVATFAVLEILKIQAGAGYAYAIGAAALVLFVVSLVRK